MNTQTSLYLFVLFYFETNEFLLMNASNRKHFPQWNKLNYHLEKVFPNWINAQMICMKVSLIYLHTIESQLSLKRLLELILNCFASRLKIQKFLEKILFKCFYLIVFKIQCDNVFKLIWILFLKAYFCKYFVLNRHVDGHFIVGKI